MKVSYRQLREYVAIDISPKELSELLTDIGLEVENTLEIGGLPEETNGLVVGEIVEIIPHITASKLQVARVNIGNRKTLNIVCGAANIAVGQKVVVALPGAVLYPIHGKPINIEKAVIRGVESEGMLCAEDEIGLGNNHEGIIVLPDHLQPGESVKEFFAAQRDVIFDIAITANRADATGHIGVARDIAAALSVRKNKEYQLIYPIMPPLDYVGDSPIHVSIENTDKCMRYSGMVISDIQIGPSPEWLQTFLRNIGLRPVNNVVDVTNFVMLEWGQPLHAFDTSVIEGNTIVVKTLPEETSFITLDGVERRLSVHDLMICDSVKPLCIAGVFGGLLSGISNTTTSIFLESASFDAVSIRKTAHRHHLHTEAAQRFEKGTDIDITITALLRAASLLKQYAHARSFFHPIDIYPQKKVLRQVWLEYNKVERTLGIAIDKEIIKKILTKLQIYIDKEHPDGLWLTIPSFKSDIILDVDVMEEIMRIYGFNAIPVPSHHKTTLPRQAGLSHHEAKKKISLTLIGMGFFEILTNSIIPNIHITTATLPASNRVVRVLKSANSGLDTLRPTMYLSGLETIVHNLNRKNDHLKFFEWGKTYHFSEDTAEYTETEHLALYTTGNIFPEHWRTPHDDKADFYYLKGVVYNLLYLMGITHFTTELTQTPEWEYGLRLYVADQLIGTLGSISKKIQTHFDIHQSVFHADLRWESIFNISINNKLVYRDIPRFPWVRRDLSLLLDQHISFNQVEQIAFTEMPPVLKSVNLFDIYKDKRLGEGKKSYAVSFIFEDPERTLTDEEVDEWMAHLMEKYKTILKAEIR